MPKDDEPALVIVFGATGAEREVGVDFLLAVRTLLVFQHDGAVVADFQRANCLGIVNREDLSSWSST